MEEVINRKDKIAIYSRKSKYTGKGESVDNQIEICKEYLKRMYGVTEDRLYVYEDEGFSAKDTNRPEFKKMMIDAKQKKFSHIICYKLDRISRNMIDFYALIEQLEKLEIKFMCATQQIETATAQGRLMLGMLSVFAQFERDVIAERVRDNMIELAKTGRWLGGTTPTGYKSKKIEKITIEGKTKSLYMLEPIEDERRIIECIFSKYMELESQAKVEEYLINNNIKTKTGKDFRRYAIRAILTNPVYAKNDKDMYEYFLCNGVEVFADEEEFNGQAGIMAYNKTDQVKRGTARHRNMKEWVVAVRKT